MSRFHSARIHILSGSRNLYLVKMNIEGIVNFHRDYGCRSDSVAPQLVQEQGCLPIHPQVFLAVLGCSSLAMTLFAQDELLLTGGELVCETLNAFVDS